MKRELRRQTEANEALLARMEQKLDLLLQQEPSTRTAPTTSSKTPSISMRWGSLAVGVGLDGSNIAGLSEEQCQSLSVLTVRYGTAMGS